MRLVSPVLSILKGELCFIGILIIIDFIILLLLLLPPWNPITDIRRGPTLINK